MKYAFKRYAVLLRRHRSIKLENLFAKIESPITFSSFACAACLFLCNWIARPIASQLAVGWTLFFLLYAVIPISATFFILYRSCWHQKITGVARTVSLILLSCAIFLGVLIISMIVLTLGLMVFLTFVDGFKRIHC